MICHYPRAHLSTLIARYACLLVLWAASQTLWAQEIHIRTIGFPPYGYHEGAVAKGIYYDAANLLAQKAGYTAINTVAPYSRIKAELIAGKADLTIMFKYDELADFVHYIAPMPSLKVVVIGLQGHDFPTLKSLKGKRLGYLRGAHFSDKIDSDPDITILEITGYFQGMKMLKARHVDAVIGPLDPILKAAINLDLSPKLLGKPLVVSVRTPWVQVSKHSKHTLSLDVLKASFKALENKGVFKRLRQQYLLLPNELD